MCSLPQCYRARRGAQPESRPHTGRRGPGRQEGSPHRVGLSDFFFVANPLSNEECLEP